jgi:glycosyltransferase involved in cell wall biosynthesis
MGSARRERGCGSWIAAEEAIVSVVLSGEAAGPAPGPGGRLRVVLVAPPYFDVPPREYGGVETVVADLADALVARGHEVVLVGAGRPGTAARFVPVWERTIPERLGQPYPEVAHPLLVRRAVEDLAADGRIDVVHDHTLGGPLNAPVYSALGAATVATVHGPVDADLRRYYRALGPEVHLVAISDRQRALAPDLNWAGRVHNALRVADWPFQPDKAGYALFLGRFHPDKAPHLALDAAHAAGIPLVLAGKCAEPAERDYFEQQVRPRLTGSDQLFGMADARAKRTLLAGARCLLFPARWEEPFGMVMIEAMACGTPVVALRAGSVPEVVADGVTGVIADDPAQLPAALELAADLDPAACRSHVAERFHVEGMAAGYEAAYLRALQAAGATGRGGGGTLGMLRREYAGLDRALDRQFRHQARGGQPATRTGA